MNMNATNYILEGMTILGAGVRSFRAWRRVVFMRTIARPGDDDNRRGLLLLAAATLLLIPALAYADVPVATISGLEVVIEGTDGAPNEVEYTVTLAGATGSAPIEIAYTVTGTATEALDYTKPSGKLTLAIGVPSGTFTIDVLHDTINDDGDTMIVTLTGTPSTDAGTVALGSPKQVTTTIRSATTQIVTVEDASVPEGGNFEFGVTVPSTGTGDVTVAYATSDISATAGTDYTAKTGRLTLARGGTGTITIETKQDTSSEGPETLSLTLSLVNPPDDVALAKSAVTGTIVDTADDLTVSVASRQETVLEGSEAAIFVVTLEPGAGSEPVVVRYGVTSNEDPDDKLDDFEAPTGTVTIPAGMRTGEISIMTLADDLLEGDEVLTLTLTPGGATVGTRPVAIKTSPDNSATTTIADIGRKTTVSVADVTVGEDEDAVFTVSLSGEVPSDVVLEYSTADDSATGGSDNADDYISASSESVTIAVGKTTTTFTVTVNPDDRVEGDESFTVTLSDLSQALVAAGVAFRKEKATATIRDNNAIVATVEGPDTVSEGSSAEYTVVLHSGKGTDDVVVDYSVGGTATADVDYTDEAKDKLTIARDADPYTGTITIDTVAVPGEAAGETLVLTLTNVSTAKGSASVGTPKSVTTVFTPSDTITVSVAPNQREVAEGAAAAFVVNLSGPTTTHTVVVDYTVGGEVAATDYTDAGSGELTLTDSARVATITLTATDDVLVEGNETISVALALSSQLAGVRIGMRAASTTITDGDTLTATIEGNQASVVEGADATFTVRLNGGATSTADTVVSYKVEDDEVTSADYTAPSGSLTIPAETATGLITIPTVDDTLSETAEDLTVKLTGVTTGAGQAMLSTNAMDTTATISIRESDGEVNISVRDAGTVNEGGDATFLVGMTGTVSQDLVVGFGTVDGTATSGSDYTANSGTLTIEKGARSATITVSTLPDTFAEGNETFTVTLNDTADTTNLEAAGVNIQVGEAMATIRDDDTLTIGVSGFNTVEEGSQAVFTVELTNEIRGKFDVVVSWRAGDETGTVTIIAGQAAGPPISIPTSSGDAGTSVTVTLHSPTTSAGSVRLATSSATTRVADVGTVFVNVSGPTGNVNEGENATFTVTPTSAFTGAVRYQTASGTADTADFRSQSGPLTFDSDAAQPVVVRTVEDSRAEDDETFSLRLTLASPRDGTVALGTDRGSATIDDDDDLEVSIRNLQTTVLEGKDARYAVELKRTDGSGSGSRPVIVSYEVTTDSAATAPEDYTKPSGKLSIPAGRSSGTIVIRTKSDDVLELTGETLAVKLTGVASEAGTVTVDGDEDTSAATTIRDVGGTVVVSVADAAPVTEGSAATFTVTLSGKVSKDVSMTVSAPANTNYSAPVPATLTIAAGETKGTITVQTTDDTSDREAENEETFTLTLELQADPPPGVVLGTTMAMGTIRDNDPLRVNLSGPRAVAATASSARFKVELSGGKGSADITVDYSYTVGGEPSTSSVNIRGGSPSADFTVTPTGGFTAGQTLVVNLTDVSPTAGSVTRGTSTARTTVVAKTISADDEAVTEGGRLTFTVTAVGTTTPDEVVVRYETVNGSARSPADFTSESGTRSISGSGTAIVVVETLSDTFNEGAETFSLRLSLVSPPAGVQLGTPSAKGTINDASDDELTATVAAGQTTVPEGTAARFIVTLSGATSTAPVVVRYTLGGDAKVEDGDYRAPADKITIPARSNSGTISIATLDDGVLDRRETLTVTLTAVDTAGATAAPSSTASTIIGDASDGVTVSVEDTTADEGEMAVFPVELSGLVSQDIKVAYATSDGIATQPADYTETSGTLTIKAGEITGTITVPTTDDAADPRTENAETFTLSLTGVTDVADVAVPGLTLGDRTATGTITDDALTANLSGPPTVKEGAAAVYTVSLTGFSGEADVVIDYTVTSTTATAGEDYSPASGTLTLAAGETSASFTIQALNDQVVDLRERLEVSIEVQDETVRAGRPVTTTIVDDGTVEVSVQADPEIVPESGEEATFTVTLTGTVADAPVTLRYETQDGSATAPADYAAADGTLTIAPGDTSATITVSVSDDGLEELTDETFNVTLSAAALPEGVEIETATATVTVTDHTLQASVSAQATVNEGQSVTFTVSLTPAGQNRSGVTVDYELGGTAVVPGDYAAPASGTLTIPQGQTSGTIVIQTVSDGVLDPGETLSVTLTDVDVVGAGLASVDSGQATATVTLVDQQTVTWSVADIEVDENRDAVFTVTLDGPVQDGVTLTYATADGTATAGSDYTAVFNGQVTVAGGSTSATFTVQVTDDTNGEASETFTVRVTRSTAPAGVEPPSATATATIRDNDLALLPIADVTVTEGGQANIVLRLERALQEPVRIGYSTAGSATAEEDYTFSVPVVGLDLPLPRGAIEVPAGVQQGEVTVAAVDDSLAEGNEQITMTLTTVTTDGSAPAVLGQVMVTIEDNDELSVSVTAPKTVAEGDVARFTVKVGGGESTAPVNVSYSLGGTAKAPADYTAPSPTMVSIPAGQQAATIAIQTKADKVLEPDETLVVTLTEATTTAGTATVGSPKSATTRIQDPAYHSINRVNRTLLPGVMRASTASALEAIGWRMAEGAQGNPAATADLAGLTGLYRALQANEYTLQDGSYDLAKVLRGSSFLVPLSSHDDDSDAGIGFAVWGGGDFRTIAGGDVAAVEWGGSVWAARVGADLRFVDSLLTGIVISFASGALDYADATPRDDREGTYGTWLASVHPYVGWTTSDFGLWASVGFGRGGLTLDDSEADAQESDLTQWSVGAGGSVTLLSTDWFIAGGTTAVKLKADGFLATATVSESENKLLQELTVGVNQARAAIEASHAQHFAGGASLKPTLEIGGRFDGGDGETGAGLEVGGGLTYADPGAGLKVAATGRALVVRDGNYGEWGVSGLLQWDPDAAGHGLMMSVRPTFGVTASGVNGLWEHGTFDLLAGSDQPGGLVKAEIGYGLPAFGPAGAITPYIGASLTDAGDHSLSLGGRIELGQMMELGLEAELRESARGGMVEHDITLEGSVRW